jgi:predicted aconitase with swiveling domain
LSFLSKPYDKEAAVGSFIILKTSRPAILPASFVACRCESLKYAGTVITACVTCSPKYLVASSANFRKTCAEISSAANFLSKAGQSNLIFSSV